MISAQWLTKLWYEQRSSSPAGREDVERNFPVRAPPPRSDWMAWRSASCWADSFWEGFRGSITIVTTQTQIDRHLVAVFQLLSFLLKSSPWTGTVYLTQNSEQQIYEVLDSFWWYRFPTVVQTARSKRSNQNSSWKCIQSQDQRSLNTVFGCLSIFYLYESAGITSFTLQHKNRTLYCFHVFHKKQPMDIFPLGSCRNVQT